MASNKQQTTEVIKVTSFSTGQANPTHPGFQQTSVELPKSDEIWGDYFNGVLRGSTDGYDGSDVTSRTFSETNSAGEGPPRITITQPAEWPEKGGAGEGGNPAGGFVPAIGSAKDGEVSSIKAVSDFIESMKDCGHGLQGHGSLQNPRDSSDKQPTSSIVADGISPSYELGKYSS